jgi:hypothetical protein
MYKIKKEYLQKNEYPVLIYVKKLGTCNEIPEPLEYITTKEYFNNINTYATEYEDSKQIFEEGKGHIKDLHIQYKHDYGWGYEKDYRNNKIRFFRVGCKHDYDVKNIGKCLNEYTCKKCGFKQEIDSSD